MAWEEGSNRACQLLTGPNPAKTDPAPTQGPAAGMGGLDFPDPLVPVGALGNQGIGKCLGGSEHQPHLTLWR